MTAPVRGADRTNVPLKPWGGFAVHRAWVYDALERLVLAGLADRVVLNTKPLSRVEAARIVSQAVRRIQSDQYGDYNHRGYLEETLYRLVEEFGPELAEMGVKTPLNHAAEPTFFGFEPVDHAEVGVDFSTRSFGLINDFGRSVAKGANGRFSFDGRMNAGDYLSFYYQPAFSLNEETAGGKLLSGYGKFTFWNVELLAGRESLWWGPGYRGSMTLSNNAFPLDQVRLGTAEPFELPWLLRYLGPIKLSTLVARLDENRDFPHTMLSGLRINIAPFRFLELGFSRMFQFGGRGRPSMDAGDFLKVFFFQQGSENPNSPTQVNNVMSFDATLRFANVQRYIYIARDMALYLDLGWDDSSVITVFIPDRPGALGGVYLAGLFGDPSLDLRVEFAKTSEIQFNHFLYTSGFTNRGFLLSHFIGTDGWELFNRVTRWINPDLLLGLQLSRAEIGSPRNELAGSPKEKRTALGMDLSYRLSDQGSLVAGADVMRVRDRNFVAGKKSTDFLFRFEYTHQFNW